MEYRTHLCSGAHHTAVEGLIQLGIIETCTNGDGDMGEDAQKIMLFDHGDRGQPGIQVRPVAQVEECLVDYASSLMGIKATWLVAADILAFCPRQGRAVLEALLSNLPVSRLLWT